MRVKDLGDNCRHSPFSLTESTINAYTFRVNRDGLILTNLEKIGWRYAAAFRDKNEVPEG